MLWKNDLSKLLKIKYPIIQAPMLGVSTPEMVAAISNAGGLGSLPVGGLSPEETLKLIHQTKLLTAQPFAVNLFVYKQADTMPATILEMQQFLESFCRQNYLPFDRNVLQNFQMHSYQDQIPLLIKENIPVVSFTFGIPDSNSIALLKKNAAVLIGTATSVKEGQLLKESGADAIAAQGLEAGGHRGTFISDLPLPLIPVLSLTNELFKVTNIPIVAAGGIHDGMSLKKAFTSGAAGVQVGTSFIGCSESVAASCYKSAVLNYTPGDTMLTKAFTGRWARGIRNKFMTAIENSGLDIPPYPMQQALTNSLRQFAYKENNKEYIPLWAGQYGPSIKAQTAAGIFEALIRQAEALD